MLLFSMFVSTLIFFAACSPGNNTTMNVSQAVSSGTWRITLFTNSGTDQTANFAGYSFTFSSGGTITVVNGSITKNGTWSVNGSLNKFSIDLGVKDNTNKPLGDLTNDWLIISSNNTEVRLKDDSSTSNELVTFTKN